jgi:hypothetical protein
MLNLMSRLLCRREKISLLPPFSLRKDFGQTKEGMPLGALKLMEGAMRQFSVGEVVTFIPDWILRSAAPGDYKIVSSMPDRDGDHMYRVKESLRRARAGCEGKSSREIGWLFAGRICTAEIAPTFDNPPVPKAVGGSPSSRADHVNAILV